MYNFVRAGGGAGVLISLICMYVQYLLLCLSVVSLAETMEDLGFKVGEGRGVW